MQFGTLQQMLNLITVTWPKIEILKFKMAASAILKIAFLAITHQPIVRFQRNFVWGSRTHVNKGYMTKSAFFFKIQDGGRPPFWKSLNRHISVKNCPILMEFGTLQQMLNLITVTWPTVDIFKIQDGGGRHLENRFFGHNSSTDCPISAKFCNTKQNGLPTNATTKTANF